MNRKVIKPKQEKICDKCGGSLGFYKNERNKFVPCNLDGSDHWDSCRADQVTGKYGEQYKKRFRTYRKGAKTTLTGRQPDQFYSGNIPPWEFIGFIDCVYNQTQIRKRTTESDYHDKEIGWTDGTVERL